MFALRVLAFAVLLCCGNAAMSQGPIASREADVKRAIDMFYAAAIRRDWDAAADFLSADFRIFVDGLEIYDRPEYVALLKSDDMITLSLDVRDVDISVSADGQMAWARFRAFIDSESNGVRSRTKTAETLILQLIGGRWHFRHSHVSFSSEKLASQ